MRLTAAIAANATSRVGRMIQLFLRANARPSARTSNSPAASGPATGLAGIGAGSADAGSSCASSLPLRQYAKRIILPRGRHIHQLSRRDYTPLRLPLG